jgi:hypothetical protein
MEATHRQTIQEADMRGRMCILCTPVFTVVDDWFISTTLRLLCSMHTDETCQNSHRAK